MLQTFSAIRSSTILDVCERLVPVLVHTRPGYFLCRHIVFIRISAQPRISAYPKGRKS